MRAFLSYYAIVIRDSNGEELEIQYFEKKEEWWVLKEHDYDRRPQTEFRRVTRARIEECTTSLSSKLSLS